MAKLLDLKTFTDARGNLTVIEKVLPFEVKRIFYLYGMDGSVRGGHRHLKTTQAVISICGRCTVYNNDGEKKEMFELDKPNKCLILEPQDWHQIHDFSEDAILIVFASDYFDPLDYLFEKYRND